jgi:hypothetical protein
MATNLGDLERIERHIDDENGEPANVISDLEALGQRDHDLFTGDRGRLARKAMDDAEVYMEDNQKDRAIRALVDAIEELKAKLKENDPNVPGGKRRRRKTRSTRRGRKSRRKSLRQRK